MAVSADETKRLETPKKISKKTKALKDGKNQDKKILVIVESPTKAQTIEKYLGPDYTVRASMGHLIDLPKSRTAIDTENNFEPEYITVRGRAKILKEIQANAKKSNMVLLASDNDREGEAIAWHLRNAISAKYDTVPIQRISFNEITPQAIRDAVASPREIDIAKVDAQKARRVLDRLVGYNLSPLLWKKVKNGLSAGRVQSVALRLICEREKEVESFIPKEYWTLDADFKVGKMVYTSQLVSWKGEKPELNNEEEVNKIIDKIKNAECAVSDVREVEKSVRPKPPFTTSQLQQAAANRLGFTSRKTMQIAQQLYEGVNVSSARVGLITYMRTDSVRVSQTALADVREWIGKNFPKALPEQANEYAVGQKAQDAHEAIRPTYTSYTPDAMKEYLNKDQLRLYTIIWERFVSSQMSNARTKTVSVDIKTVSGDDEGIFRIAGTKIIEKGFYQVMKLLSSKEEKGNPYPALKMGDQVRINKFHPEQHFTQGPSRYTDATIVRTLEEKGIGRPSTYAPIISVLLDRYYVVRTNKQLVPTVLGRLINDVLVDYFPHYIDTGFTASMEAKLDGVEDSQILWPDMIREFWYPFKVRVDEVTKSLESFKQTLDEPTDLLCEKCGKPLIKKLGRFGFFLACSGFPDCKNARSIPLAKCPKCGGDVVARKTKGRGKEFYGCTNYPDCDFLTHFKPLKQDCPKCGWFLVESKDKKNGEHKTCINPDCDYLHSTEDECEDSTTNHTNQHEPFLGGQE